MTGVPDLIDRAVLCDKIEALIVAASRQWGVGSVEHNLVRDIGDAVARVPSVRAALPIPDEGLVDRLWALAARQANDRRDMMYMGTADPEILEAADTITRLSAELREAREALGGTPILQ